MVERMDRQQLLSLAEEDNVQIVDVLPQPEFMAAHIPGALNILLKTLKADTTAILSRAKPVVVY